MFCSETFDMDLTKVDWRHYYQKLAYGLSRYVAKEDIPESAITGEDDPAAAGSVTYGTAVFIPGGIRSKF